MAKKKDDMPYWPKKRLHLPTYIVIGITVLTIVGGVIIGVRANNQKKTTEQQIELFKQEFKDVETDNDIIIGQSHYYYRNTDVEFVYGGANVVLFDANGYYGVGLENTGFIQNEYTLTIFYEDFAHEEAKTVCTINCGETYPYYYGGYDEYIYYYTSTVNESYHLSGYNVETKEVVDFGVYADEPVKNYYLSHRTYTSLFYEDEIIVKKGDIEHKVVEDQIPEGILTSLKKFKYGPTFLYELEERYFLAYQVTYEGLDFEHGLVVFEYDFDNESLSLSLATYRFHFEEEFYLFINK